ncbi:hypothetical protein BPUTSESOX_806 [uncultured Gammaproteobacteria bacterium]|nr:hypothetical protein BPUTSESOX_806 [uncultured Gammaproteobacteria bacterium]
MGHKTPFQVFTKLTGKDYFLNRSVTLVEFAKFLNNNPIAPLLNISDTT